MPDNYSYKSSGTNSQGNHYCSRDYGSGAANSNSYHYSNSCVAPLIILYLLAGRRGEKRLTCELINPNGSTYYNSGTGYSNYTPPSGGNGGSGGQK
uniref:Uncharacterized protein n=1 Tax=Talaromyces marneffei PM1 TaxID=1077442 RepID=A0A093VBR8_TALMA